jgi:SAM-dependent methyltransferase
VNVESDQEERGFEYVVPQEWIDRIFEGLASKPKAKPRTPDHLMIRVSGSSDISFYATGHIATRQIRDLLHEVGKDLNDFHTILDFGCGCARVLMAFFHEGVNAEFYGSDIDEEAMLWAQKNFAPAARFNANGVLPPTRHESNMFDFVYAISVFTHLPEDHQDAWLSELARILKPGGVLITTVHGPRTQSFLPPEVRAAVERKGFLYVDQTNKDWPSYLGAKTDGLPDFYRLSYHTFDYVRTKWSKYFDILTIKEQGLNFLQDAVVCQKR